MSRISEMLKNDEREKEYISNKVNEENLVVSEEEIKTTADVIKEISYELSGKYKDLDTIPEDEIKEMVAKKCTDLNLSFEDQKRIEKNVLMTALGSGPIEPLIQDKSVTEIIVQRYDSVIIERNGRLEDTSIVFNNEEHLMTIINRMVQRVGRQINRTTPIVDARLLDGSRINAVIPPVAPDGAELVIRKFPERAFTGEDYLRLGSMNEEMLDFLAKCVKGRVSIFVSGGTGTGKTTLLNMLSSYIPPNESIITIEDTCELRLQQPRVRRREVRTSNNSSMMNVDQQALVKAALRQRPDRIILGETRDGSVVDLISAMSTGHEGSMSTIHANSPKDMLNVRIPICYSYNKDANFSERSISMQVAAAVQLIVQIKRFGKDRKIDRITEITGVDEFGKVTSKDIFVYLPLEKRFEATGYVPENLITYLQEHGVEVDKRIFRGSTSGSPSNDTVRKEEKEDIKAVQEPDAVPEQEESPIKEPEKKEAQPPKTPPQKPKPTGGNDILSRNPVKSRHERMESLDQTKRASLRTDETKPERPKTGPKIIRPASMN